MSRQEFSGPVQDSNVLTGVHASGDARQTFNFFSHSSQRPCYVIAYERNRNFISRPDINDRLANLLPHDSNDSQSAALWGLGGSGKTQIALEYAYSRCHDQTCSVFWVHAENEATFSHDYKSIARALGLGGNLDGQELLDTVRRAIESQHRWLLVVDNADDLSLFGVSSRRDQPKSTFLDYIPKGPRGTVLWTSRVQKVDGSLVDAGRGIQVAKMSTQEAKRLLETRRAQVTGDEELQELEHLLEELQWLPLAISQAGAYMRRTDTPMAEYLSHLKEEKERWGVLQETEFDRHRRTDAPNSILETWSISIRRIKEEDTVAYRILHILAYLDNQSIPWELLVAASARRRKNTAPDTMRLKRSVGLLKDFSFITEHRARGSEPSIEMHKLVQDAARYGLFLRTEIEKSEEMPASRQPKSTRARLRLPPKSIRGTDKAPERVADKTTVQGEGFFCSAALSVIATLFPENDAHDHYTSELWPQCEKYLAHALQVCDWAEMCGEERRASDVLEQASGYLYSRGRHREEEAAIEKKLRLMKKVVGEKHSNYIFWMYRLGWSVRRQGRDEESEEIAKRALKLAQSELGDEHRETLRCKQLLAAAYQGQNRFDEAEQLIKETLNQANQLFGESDKFTVACSHDLARVYIYQEQYGKAGELLPRVVQFNRDTYGEKYPETLMSLHQLAVVYDYQEQYDKAEELYTKALELERQEMGNEHPETLTTMNNLATVWRSQGRLGDAVRLMRECSAFRHKVLGPDHLYTKGSHRWLEIWAKEDETMAHDSEPWTRVTVSRELI
ncbi:hypothetical protein ACJ41O_005508 [Fusarium nematophilum]